MLQTKMWTQTSAWLASPCNLALLDRDSEKVLIKSSRKDSFWLGTRLKARSWMLASAATFLKTTPTCAELNQKCAERKPSRLDRAILVKWHARDTIMKKQSTMSVFKTFSASATEKLQCTHALPRSMRNQKSSTRPKETFQSLPHRTKGKAWKNSPRWTLN